MSEADRESQGADASPEGERGKNTLVVLPPRRDAGPDSGPSVRPWLRGAVLLLLILSPLALYGAWSRGLIDLRDASGLESFFDREGSGAADTMAAAQNKETPVRNRFRRLADSLDVAIRTYDRWRSNFPEDGTSCETLRTSFDEVEGRFSDLSLRYGENRGLLGFDLTRRYERLVAAVDSVAQHYEESGCAQDD